MCSAVALTDEAGLQPFATPSGWMGSIGPPPQQTYTREELEETLASTQPVLHDLLDAVADRAPSLRNREALLPLARLAAWTKRDEWVRPLDDWPGEQQVDADKDMAKSGGDSDEHEDGGANEAATLRSLAAHLLEKWDVPETLHGALAFSDGPSPTEAAHRVSRAFLKAHAAVGRGDASVLSMLRSEVSPAISKAAAKHFVKAQELADATAAEANSKGKGNSGSVIDKLTEAQLDEFREAFNSFDKDGGGSIDSKELKDLMASVGQNPTDDELAEMIRIADADGTGDIDFAEFVTLMAHKMADEKSEATLKAAFSVFDTSGDGFISAEEMRRIMINVGEPVTLDDVEQVIRKVDIDGDGVINYEEFTKVIVEEKATQFGQAGGK